MSESSLLFNTTEVVGGDSEIWKELRERHKNNLKWIKPTGVEVPLWWLLLRHHVFAGRFDSLLTQHMDQWGRLEPEYTRICQPGHTAALTVSLALCSALLLSTVPTFGFVYAAFVNSFTLSCNLQHLHHWLYWAVHLMFKYLIWYFHWFNSKPQESSQVVYIWCQFTA